MVPLSKLIKNKTLVKSLGYLWKTKIKIISRLGKKTLKKSIFYQSNVKHRQDFNLKGNGMAEVVHLDTRKVIGEKKSPSCYYRFAITSKQIPVQKYCL